MKFCKTVLLMALAAAVISSSAMAEENAALRKYGATISVTCNSPKPLNSRWAKPSDMLKEEKPGGPIITDLVTGEITIGFPMPMQIEQVGFKVTDYRGGFSRAREVEIKAENGEAKTVELSNEVDDVQFFQYSAKAKSITFKVKSIFPPKKGGNAKYGTFNQVQVIVKEDLAQVFSAPESYVTDLPTYAMRTRNLDPQAITKVIGEPRKSTSYPKTIWDSQDIAEIKQQIKTIPAAKDAYERCVAFCENAVKNPLTVPSEPDNDTNPAVAAMHTRVAAAIANLGIGYALSGNEAYAKEAKKLLLQLADYYEGWPVHKSPKFNHDASKWSWQRLGDAIWLIQAAWGFDLIHNSPSVSDEEKAKIRDHFVMPCVKNIMRSPGIITAPTNWSVICCAAVMIGARVSGDEEFYEKSIYGLTRKAEDQKGGIFFHIDKGLDDDGMWGEGAIGYQFMAMRGLIVMAEILWRDGIDVYGHNNSRLKMIFDSPIWYCYPGGSGSPAIHDSGSASVFGRDAHLYQYAMRRYADKTYNPILAKITPTFESIYNLFLPAFDFSPVDPADLPRIPSILFPGVGFASTRSGDGLDAKYLLVDYGPNRSHGHPDKLNHCLYALGQELFADAGSAWYSTDIYQRYYSHSLAHNTITANGMNQIMTGGKLEAYSQSGDVSVIRASCDTAIPSNAMDRTLVLVDGRLYDIFLSRSRIPFTLDLPYHSHGTIEQTVATEEWKEYPKDENGYCYFKDPKYVKMDGDWDCTWKVKSGSMKMRYLGEKDTELIFATTPKGGSKLGTVMVRRKTPDTVFANVCDIIPSGGAESIKSVKSFGDQSGYLMVAELADGSKEVVLVNFTGNRITLAGWSTDARVAFVRVKGGKTSDFTLAGGSMLTGEGVSVTLSAPSLIAYNRYNDGLFRLENQGETATSVVISGASFDKAMTVKEDGSWGDSLASVNGGFTVPAYVKLDLVKGKQIPVVAFIEKQRRVKLEEAIAAEKLRREAIEKEVAAQVEEARSLKIPEGYFALVQAEDVVREGGGKVNLSSNKTAVYGKAFSGWNNNDHWLEYDFEVEHDGYYQVVMKYCLEGDDVIRSLWIDGELPNPASLEMTFGGTGGWSNGSDNWKFYSMNWPLSDKPILVRLATGKHVLKLNNTSGGGLNLDYIVFVPMGVEPDRKMFEK